MVICSFDIFGSTHLHNLFCVQFLDIYSTLKKIEQKGMTFDHDFVYYFHLFSSLLKIEGRRKGERIAKS